MARLTTYESNHADAWLTGMSEPDDVDDDREAAWLRAGWDLLDSDIQPAPAHDLPGRNIRRIAARSL